MQVQEAIIRTETNLKQVDGERKVGRRREQAHDV